MSCRHAGPVFGSPYGKDHRMLGLHGMHLELQSIFWIVGHISDGRRLLYREYTRAPHRTHNPFGISPHRTSIVFSSRMVPPARRLCHLSDDLAGRYVVVWNLAALQYLGQLGLLLDTSMTLLGQKHMQYWPVWRQ